MFLPAWEGAVRFPHGEQLTVPFGGQYLAGGPGGKEHLGRGTDGVSPEEKVQKFGQSRLPAGAAQHHQGTTRYLRVKRLPAGGKGQAGESLRHGGPWQVYSWSPASWPVLAARTVTATPGPRVYADGLNQQPLVQLPAAAASQAAQQQAGGKEQYEKPDSHGHRLLLP